MANRLYISPDRDKKSPYSEWASTRCKAEFDEVRETSESPKVSDINSPTDSPVQSHYNGESLDFGDSSGQFI